MWTCIISGLHWIWEVICTYNCEIHWGAHIWDLLSKTNNIYKIRHKISKAAKCSLSNTEHTCKLEYLTTTLKWVLVALKLYERGIFRLRQYSIIHICCFHRFNCINNFKKLFFVVVVVVVMLRLITSIFLDMSIRLEKINNMILY